MALAFPKPTRADRRPRMDYTGLALAKEVPARDSEYRAYVRTHPCSIRGLKRHRCLMPIDAAHIGVTGTGIKSSDYAEIPLCRAAHMRQTAIGWARFILQYGINPFEIAFRLLEYWHKQIVKR